MEFNFVAILLAAFSSLVVGFIWYNPKVFGTVWMNETGMTEEKAKKSNMALTLFFAFVYAFFIAFILQFLVIHQFGVFGVVGGNVENEAYKAFMTEENLNAFRSFKHGMLHGAFTGLFFALPVVGVGALFEQKSFKYVLVSGGYWVVTCMVMGGIICAMK
ncbi:DUF1761 domain-containing protein [Myroides sp. JBRI-B21084]|uniref:DUF1761 domain-containing protein n=1 Tax=Myroides sp. JBRI-B21084 TaxID=3119977 RepID=UPI0026E2DD98|nr:DUF1761 domain-containing protein [Paenimyroides cloacae]WKW47185.1 DUF1761 domain-containing protein [Paenimyroides cloacae]